MHITIKQGIDNCYLVQEHGHPGYEEERKMNMEDFNWDLLYKNTEDYMNIIRSKDFHVMRNKKSMFGNSPVVEVEFPKRINCIAMNFLNNNDNCTRYKGYKKDGVLYCRYGIHINDIN